MCRHRSLRDIPDALTLWFHGLVNILLLLEEFTKMTFALAFGIRCNELISYIIILISKVLGRRVSSSDIENLGFLLSSSLLQFINLIEWCSNWISYLLWRTSTYFEVTSNQTWLFSLCLCEHRDLCSPYKAPILCLSIWNLYNGLWTHLWGSRYLLLLDWPSNPHLTI